MESLAKLLSSLSEFAWPALLLIAVVQFRRQNSAFFLTFQQQLASGAMLKWKDLEFRGVELNPFSQYTGNEYSLEEADYEIYKTRERNYKVSKNIFLVHRFKPTGRLHKITNLPTYDISIYLVSHKNFGHLNDIAKVEYYFGRHFGISRGQYGAKFVVENGTESFAVRINAYGPTLCEARIIFHDGQTATVSRYLDFEGSGYRFDPRTNEIDKKKLQKQLEE